MLPIYLDPPPVGPAPDTHPPRRVLLVCPPFHDLHYASIATARLATFLRQKGVPCAEAYLHFELAGLLGTDRYAAATTAELVAELLFAEGLHGPLPEPSEAKLSPLFGGPSERATLLDRFKDICLKRVATHRPDLVGFTTSNNQLLPALWIAAALKRAYPEVEIVLGGASCNEPMGERILAAYPQVDRVVSGHGEAPLLALAFGRAPPDRHLASPERMPFAELPLPEYRAFLQEAGDHDDPRSLWLTYESARGCWWGNKHHCTFCGLSGVDLRFDERASQEVVHDLRTLWDEYHHPILVTDLILSRHHQREVLPELARTEDGPPLFYELKTNLTQSDMALFHDANVRACQLGIESLSTRLLGLIRKGTNMLQNLAVLKWVREQGIATSWNLLYGIPGETEADYDPLFPLLQRIWQLPAPTFLNPIRIDRYSPYFNSPNEFGWEAIRPLSEYCLLHPQLDAAALADIAYHFEGVGGVSTRNYRDRLAQAVAEWQLRSHRGDGLFLVADGELLQREDGIGRAVPLTDVERQVLDATHEPVTELRLLERTGASRAVVEGLEARGILVREGAKVLNVAVRKPRPKVALST